MAKGKAHLWRTPEKLTLVSGWRMDGLSDAQVAKNIGISRSTLYVWLDKYPDFADAYKKGADIADYEVMNALFRSATGYARKEIVIDVKGEEHTVIKWYPPNTAAQIFWMKNRKKWRDKPEDTVSQDGQPIYVAILPDRTEIDEGG